MTITRICQVETDQLESNPDSVTGWTSPSPCFGLALRLQRPAMSQQPEVWSWDVHLLPQLCTAADAWNPAANCGHDKPARDSLSGLCGHRLTAFVLTGQKMNLFKSAGCCCEPLSSAVLLLHGQKEQSWQQRRKLPCKDQPVRLLHLSWSPSLKG